MRRLARVRASTLLTLSSIAFTALFAAACDPNYLPPPDNDWKPGTHTHTLNVQDDDRSYVLHVPSARPRNRLAVLLPYPMVIVLHGSGANGETVRQQSGLDRLADSLHFLAVYPNGSDFLFGFGSDWNAGTCCGNAARSNTDDIAFVHAVTADIGARLPIDRRRVFVAGFSDGARMAYHLACDASASIAAIAVISGSLVDDSCTPTRAVPLIAFHGTSDTEVPYDDSARAVAVRPPLPAAAGLPPSIRFWSSVNQCQRLAIRRDTPHVVRAQFGGCGGGEVLFFSIDSGAHAWPGGMKDGKDGFEPTTELRASDAMVSFFYRHPIR
jgi:polyhydroxybutyrate depolymerase